MPTALVTGAGIRVGRAIAEGLAAAGYDLALHANRSTAPVEALAEQLRKQGRQATVYQADLTQPDDVERLADEVTRRHPVLDVVVHNAALFERVPYAQVTREQFRRMQALNLEAPYFLTQRLLPALERAPDPLIVHLTDIMGERGTKGFSHYSLTKAALLHLTKALATELAPKIRVNAISPGTVAFPDDYDDEARARVLRKIPLGRVGTPDDIARAVRFFAESPFVTGQVIAVDGGRSALL